MLERTTSFGKASALMPSMDYASRFDTVYTQKSPAARKQTVSQEITFENDVPRAAMALKEATSLLAMYLTFPQRDRLFGELDFLLDPEEWDEHDALPNRRAFVNFLKWAVATKRHDWTSLGLDGDGNTSVAFKRGGNLVTALFLPNDIVQWTSKRDTEDGPDVAAGQSPLRVFANNSPALLERL
ncbi:hypothetical protein IB279_02705 [Ensifer sp. ENS06]|uniref:hypothetical protein n=1 Tax=Ensifer sp. ENS06 TaxID=2769276 RepID=UPI00177F4BF3|nr:hypothetical protein [Ensifer sp. ENS06]MBD9621849.1 hypothetical protein [Ensifer sp. ENS06]